MIVPFLLHAHHVTLPMTTTIKTTTIQPVSTTLPTQYGNFQIMAFPRFADDPMPHLVMVAEGFSPENTTLVRIHSECITGDLFGSKRCDCGQQLHTALQMTAKSQRRSVALSLIAMPPFRGTDSHRKSHLAGIRTCYARVMPITLPPRDHLTRHQPSPRAAPFV